MGPSKTSRAARERQRSSENALDDRDKARARDGETLITSAVLYQLSYVGADPDASAVLHPPPRAAAAVGLRSAFTLIVVSSSPRGVEAHAAHRFDIEADLDDLDPARSLSRARG